jgi:PAS domain S-box-containing protein
MMVITDKNATILDVNPSFERIYKYKKEEVIGKNPRILQSDHSSPELYKKMWDNLLHKGYWQGEIINVDKYGNEHPVLLSINTIRNEQKEITHFVGIGLDITQRVKSKQKIEELSLFPETNPDFVLKLDSKGHVMYMNPATEKALDTLQVTLQELLPEDIERKVKKVTDTKEIISEEKKIGEIVVDYTFALFPDGQSVLLRGKDITTMKDMEHQLEEYSKHLERIVKEKTDILKVLYDLEYVLKDASLKEGVKIIKKSGEKLGFDTVLLYLYDGETVQSVDGKTIKDPVVSNVLQERKSLVDTQNGLVTVWYPVVYHEDVLGVCGFVKSGSLEEDRDYLRLFAGQVARFLELRKILIEPAVERELKSEKQYTLHAGVTYLVEEESPEKSFDIFMDFVTHGVSGLCITRTNPRFVKERYTIKKTPVIWLSSLKTDEYTTSVDLTELSISIKDFVRKGKSIILVDGIEFLITKYSFEEVLSFLQSLIEFISMTESVVVVPISPKTVDVKELKLLEREMILFEMG